MQNDKNEILDYWNRNDVESMYDKHLLDQEIQLIKSHLTEDSRILDVGCGEGEGTLQYASIPNVEIHAADFSDTRLEKAKQNLQGLSNVKLLKIDFLKDYVLEEKYDFIISQRFLINIKGWDVQKKVISNLIELLKPEGRLLLFEGSKIGTNELNNFRDVFGLPPISIKWHNDFLDDNEMTWFLKEKKLTLFAKYGLGEYFLLTRGLRPVLSDDLNWNSKFNEDATKPLLKNLLGLNDKFSRLKLWIIG